MSATTKANELQEQGTREFEEAISGKGPKMPASSTTKAEEAELNKALEDTFPASDPVQPSSPESSVGAPSGRKSVDGKKEA